MLPSPGLSCGDVRRFPRVSSCETPVVPSIDVDQHFTYITEEVRENMPVLAWYGRRGMAPHHLFREDERSAL